MEHTRNDEMEIDLIELFYAIKRRLLIVILAALLCAGISGVYTRFLVTPIYTSMSSMLVLTKETTLSSLADLQMGAQLTNDYRVLITSRPVLDEVIENLDLNMDYKALESMITVNNPENTRILEIQVNHSSPEMAMEIVNELAEVSSDFIGDKMEVVPPKIIEKGEVPKSQTSPSMVKNIALGLLAGLALSMGIIAMMTIMDDTIKSEEDIEKYLGLSTLACVPDRKDYISGVKTRKKRKKKKSKHKKKGEGSKWIR